MRILILYTFNKGLLSEFFQELSGKLSDDGFEVFNFYLKHNKDAFKQGDVQFFGEKRGNHFYNYWHVFKIINQTQPDVIISNFSYVNPALLFGKLKGVKYNIAWFHTVYGHGKPNSQKVFVKSLFLRMADMVIANSPVLQKEMHSIYKVSKQRICAIPFWTNIVSYRSVSNPLKITKKTGVLQIGCPGRLLADKNHSIVIRALYQLKQNCQKPLCLYIAGSGPYQKPLEELVVELGLEENVIFLGLLNVPEMVEFYDAMDIVVLPSFHEAFGLVFIEAIALGTPVLVSNAFGALDFIDKQKFSVEGFSFDPYQVEDLVDKLEPYLNNSDVEPDYFKAIYKDTFEKDAIYQQIKSVILNQTVPSR